MCRISIIRCRLTSNYTYAFKYYNKISLYTTTVIERRDNPLKNKRVLHAVLLCLFVCVLPVFSCKRNPKGESTKTDVELLIIERASELEAKKIRLSMKENSLEIFDECLYTFPINSNYNKQSIFPLYSFNNHYVFRERPTSVSASITCEVADDLDRLISGEYSIRINREECTYTVYHGKEVVYDKITTDIGDKAIIPCAFCVENDSIIKIIGMTDEEFVDSELILATYKETAQNSNKVILSSVYVFSSIWDEYGISKSECPQNINGYTNIKYNEERHSFLYNESTKLMEISLIDNSISLVMSEEEAVSVIKYFDPHRDFYSFFSDFHFVDGFYIISFPAYNSLAGTYVIVMSEEKEVLCYMLCEEKSITISYKNGLRSKSIDGSFIPDCFIY